jgi:hypothetical protein
MGTALRAIPRDGFWDFYRRKYAILQPGAPSISGFLFCSGKGEMHPIAEYHFEDGSDFRLLAQKERPAGSPAF